MISASHSNHENLSSKNFGDRLRQSISTSVNRIVETYNKYPLESLAATAIIALGLGTGIFAIAAWNSPVSNNNMSNIMKTLGSMGEQVQKFFGSHDVSDFVSKPAFAASENRSNSSVQTKSNETKPAVTFDNIFAASEKITFVTLQHPDGFPTTSPDPYEMSTIRGNVAFMADNLTKRGYVNPELVTIISNLDVAIVDSGEAKQSQWMSNRLEVERKDLDAGKHESLHEYFQLNLDDQIVDTEAIMEGDDTLSLIRMNPKDPHNESPMLKTDCHLNPGGKNYLDLAHEWERIEHQLLSKTQKNGLPGIDIMTKNAYVAFAYAIPGESKWGKTMSADFLFDYLSRQFGAAKSTVKNLFTSSPLFGCPDSVKPK